MNKQVIGFRNENSRNTRKGDKSATESDCARNEIASVK